MTVKEKGVLVDLLQKQEDRDAQGRFRRAGPAIPRDDSARAGRAIPRGGRPGRATRRRRPRSCCSTARPRRARRAVELALAGDGMALRLCLDRIIPPRRGRPVQLDAAGARRRRSRRHDGGDHQCGRFRRDHPREAAELARVVEIFVRAVETSDFERRLRELEDAHAARM